MQVKSSQAIRMVTSAIMAKLVPFIKGSPGIGKSQIVHQIAADYNLLVIDLRLSQCDPTDLMGFPQIDQARQKAGYLPMETFPLEDEPLPKGYLGWLLFLDEANSAPKAVQAASYKIMLDRMIGQKHLHSKCAVVAAGNLETDNAIVEPLSTALQTRMVHLELVVDHIEWNDWAVAKGLDHRITDYIKFKPGNLYTFKADHSDDTYACPRTWEFADRIFKTNPDSRDELPLLAGILSEGVARELITFCKIYASLPKMERIIASPESIKVPDETSILYAITGSIAHNITEENTTPLLKFVKRIPEEFQVVCLREVIRKHKPLLKHPAIIEWVSTRSVKLF